MLVGQIEMEEHSTIGIEKMVQSRLRVTWGESIALGPGKAELLELVAQTGSIAEAAKRMDMSYMRAWTLIRTMNGCFKEPLVDSVRGGSKGGGATLTASGREVLSLYRQMERDCEKASLNVWPSLSKLLKD